MAATRKLEIDVGRKFGFNAIKIR